MRHVNNNVNKSIFTKYFVLGGPLIKVTQVGVVFMSPICTKCGSIDCLCNAEQRDALFVALSAADPELQYLEFPAGSAPFMHHACIVALLNASGPGGVWDGFSFLSAHASAGNVLTKHIL